MSSQDDGGLVLETALRDDAVVVRVAGEVDFRVVPLLRDELNDALALGRARLVVDLSALTWVDSLGLGVLVAAWKRARAGGTELVLWRPSSKAMAILRLARLDRLMTIVLEDPFEAA